MIVIFEYFESNNNAKQVMQGGLKLNTTAMQVLRVFQLAVVFQLSPGRRVQRKIGIGRSTAFTAQRIVPHTMV